VAKASKDFADTDALVLETLYPTITRLLQDALMHFIQALLYSGAHGKGNNMRRPL
jgi:hypothetical protein